MKKNLLLTLIIFATSYSVLRAQAISISPSDSVSTTADVQSNNDEVDLYAYVHNDSTADLTINWRVLTNVSPAGWNVSLCDNTNCLDIATTSQSSFILKADSQSILKIAYLPFLEAGVSDIYVKVSIAGVPNSDRFIHYKGTITATPTAIRSLDTKSLSIYPNPSSNYIQINGVDNTDHLNSIEVYNIIGKMVYSSQVNAVSDLRVNIQNYENGVYLVKLFDNRKNLFYTKTFVKK